MSKKKLKIDGVKLLGAFTAFGFAISKKTGGKHPSDTSILEDAYEYGKLISDKEHIDLVANMINDDALSELLNPPHVFGTKKKCVHTEHCCAKFGCKYGDAHCPVWLGYSQQSGPSWDGISGVDYIPSISTAEFTRRRFQSIGAK